MLCPPNTVQLSAYERHRFCKCTVDRLNADGIRDFLGVQVHVWERTMLVAFVDDKWNLIQSLAETEGKDKHTVSGFFAVLSNIPTTYRSPVPKTYTDHMPTTYWPHTEHIRTVLNDRLYRKHTDHEPTTYRPQPTAFPDQITRSLLPAWIPRLPTPVWFVGAAHVSDWAPAGLEKKKSLGCFLVWNISNGQVKNYVACNRLGGICHSWHVRKMAVGQCGQPVLYAIGRPLLQRCAIWLSLLVILARDPDRSTHLSTAFVPIGSYMYCTSKSPRAFVPRSLRILVTIMISSVMSFTGRWSMMSRSVHGSWKTKMVLRRMTFSHKTLFEAVWFSVSSRSGHWFNFRRHEPTKQKTLERGYKITLEVGGLPLRNAG